MALLPEAAEAIRIADKHLPNARPPQRLALALDIQEAIIRFAGSIAIGAIGEGFDKARAANKSLKRD